MDLTIISGERLPAAGDEAVFEQVFKAHFKALYGYAYTLLKNEGVAEEIVQQVFFKLWERREQTTLHLSLKAYLYRSVHNESMNYLKHIKVKQQHQTYTMHRQPYETATDPATALGNKELEQHIREALQALPEQCRTIFQMSRFEDLKYREIAERMQLSVKTVENQMGKALHLLRDRLAGYIVSLIFFFFTQKLF